MLGMRKSERLNLSMPSMIVPRIDPTEVQKTLELAEELLIPYKNELECQKIELEITKVELSAAQALASILKRDKLRRVVLEGSGDAGSYYCAQTMGRGLDAHEQFISILEYRFSRFSRKIELCNQAIQLLESDIVDLKKLQGIKFRDMVLYFSYITDEPSWSFFMYRPEKWFARWAAQA